MGQHTVSSESRGRGPEQSGLDSLYYTGYSNERMFLHKA